MVAAVDHMKKAKASSQAERAAAIELRGGRRSRWSLGLLREFAMLVFEPVRLLRNEVTEDEVAVRAPKSHHEQHQRQARRAPLERYTQDAGTASADRLDNRTYRKL